MSKRYLDDSSLVTEQNGTNKKFKSQKQENEHSEETKLVVDSRSSLDGEGLLKWRDFESVGELLEPPNRRRYKLIDEIAKGGWAIVVRSWDRVQRRYVALKIASIESSVELFSKTEIEILRDMIEYDNLKRDSHIPNCCIQLNTSFSIDSLSCLAFNEYGMDFYSLLKKNNFRPLDIEYVKAIGYQLFGTLYHLHSNMQIIHTDIKLENLLFESPELKQASFSYRKDGTKDHYFLPKTSKIKLIDFGNAIKATHPHPNLISTRAYRSPEVLLELGYSYETDVWSIGCVLLELYLGRPFFTSSLSVNETENDLEQLNNFQSVLGSIPQDILTNYKEEYCNGEKYERIIPASSAVARFFKIESKGDFEQFVLKKVRITQNERLTDLITNNPFYDLLRRTLEYKPSKRIKPMEALKHPFFK